MAKEKKVKETTEETVEIKNEEENIVSEENEKQIENSGNELEKRVLELEDKNVRLQAEFINYKTRSETEKMTMFKYEGENIIKQIIEVVDDFERAIMMDNNDLSDEVSNFLKGFKMIYTRLIGILNNLGVSEIDVEGKEFDPNFAEAVITEHDETKPMNVVLEVLKKGYMYKDKLIRPAMVKVNK